MISNPTMTERHIPLEGVDNLRDYGGYAAAGGGAVRTGLLYRSASHHDATDADLEAMAGLGLTLIVDLRRKEERARSPSRRPPCFVAEVIDNDLGDPGESWEEMLRGVRPTQDLFRSMSLQWYRTAALEPRHLDLYARYFAALSDGTGPVLIHCAAGKDRTGILAALTHHLLGVHRDDMLADYLLTNDLDFHEVRAPTVARMIAGICGEVPDDAAVRAAMSVEAHYLEAAFASIQTRFGSLDAYLEQALGVDDRRRAAIARHLLT